MRARQSMKRTSWFFLQEKEWNWIVWWCLSGWALLLCWLSHKLQSESSLPWMSGNQPDGLDIQACSGDQGWWMGSLLRSSTCQGKVLLRPFWKGVAVALPMAGWLPECWYDQSSGDVGWVEATFPVVGWRRRGEKGRRVVYRYIIWIVGSGPLLVTGTRVNLPWAPKWYTVSGLAL